MKRKPNLQWVTRGSVLRQDRRWNQLRETELRAWEEVREHPRKYDLSYENWCAQSHEEHRLYDLAKGAEKAREEYEKGLWHERTL